MHRTYQIIVRVPAAKILNSDLLEDLTVERLVTVDLAKKVNDGSIAIALSQEFMSALAEVRKALKAAGHDG